MRSALSLSASLLGAVLCLPLSLPANAAIVVAIDKSAQRMTVTVDGEQRYVWPVSTGRAGYDTPNGTFKPNRMDADHLSQEWDNAPMPHTIFFDMSGHAIHGFFDVKHLGLAVSHGCVRLSPDHAATLFDLVKTERMSNTTVVVSGRTPAGQSPEVAGRRTPADASAAVNPMRIAPDYSQQPARPYDQEQPPQYAQPPEVYYGQARPAYGQPPTYYRAAAPQPYYAQPQYYGQPGYPPQPPPPQFAPFRPFGQ